MLLYLFYGQTSWQKSMKTNISCIISRKLLLGVPSGTSTISLSPLSLSLFLFLSLFSLCLSVVGNVATGNTQLAPSDICYVNFLWQPSISYRHRHRRRRRCRRGCLRCCCCYLLTAPLCVDKWLRSSLEFQRAHTAGTSQNRWQSGEGRQGAAGGTLAKCWKLILSLQKRIGSIVRAPFACILRRRN